MEKAIENNERFINKSAMQMSNMTFHINIMPRMLIEKDRMHLFRKLFFYAYKDSSVVFWKHLSSTLILKVFSDNKLIPIDF